MVVLFMIYKRVIDITYYIILQRTKWKQTLETIKATDKNRKERISYDNNAANKKKIT